MRTIHGFESQESKEQDRISALPDCLIQHILSFLPSTKQAIQTGILSKRWRNQWAHVPLLVFESAGKSDQSFSQFIERTLILHDCLKIKKFQIKYAQLASDPQLAPKIRLATNRHVEELILHLSPLDKSNKNLRLPEFLFSNDSLVKLELFKFYFSENQRANWPNLKELRLDFSNVHRVIIKNILRGCPLLELLEITNSSWYRRAVIASKSLKKLTFIDTGTTFTDIKHHRVIISCPNLEELRIKSRFRLCSLLDITIENVLSSSPFLHTLELSGWFCSPRLVIASTSLKNLVLGRCRRFPDLEILCPGLEKCQLMYPSTLFIGENIDRDSLAIKILQQLQHVKFLDIGRWLIQTPNVEGSSSLSLNCKCLVLDGNCFDRCFPRIVSVISCSPLLEKLVIKLPPNQSEKTVANMGLTDSRKNNSLNSDGVVINCSVPNLKTVEIISLSEGDESCKLVFNFVEFLLKNGRVLEKIVFILGECSKGFIFDVSKKLLSFPRCSPDTKIELF